MGMARIPDGNRESLPTLPPPASTAGIPINFGIISHKTTTKKGKKKKNNPQPQPTLPKGKQKNSQNFHFGVSGDVGKAQNPRDEKEPRWFFFVYQQLQGLGTTNGSGVYSNQNPRKKKKWEAPVAIPTSQPSFGWQPIPKGKKKIKIQTILNRNWEFHFFLSLSAESSEFREYRDVLLSRLEKEQGKGAATNSAH